MKLNGLNVSGISKVVIKAPNKLTKCWVLQDGVWYGSNSGDVWGTTTKKSHTKQVEFIKYAVSHPDKYYVWICKDTVNIRILPQLEKKQSTIFLRWSALEDDERTRKYTAIPFTNKSKMNNWLFEDED